MKQITAKLMFNDGAVIDKLVSRSENLPPAGVIEYRGRVFTLGMLNQDLWESRVFTYHEVVCWKVVD